MNKTICEIGSHLIKDSFLKQYSYKGQSKKLRFKNYDNITKLVVRATLLSMGISEDDKESYYKAEDCFTKEYIRAADRRSKQKNPN